jgi:prepilin-type N-terminal cleavage/methylation domain-containing protein
VRKKISAPQAGFSLLEMMVVVAILTIVMAVVMTQTELVQKRYSAEEQRLDVTQESREFFDQLVRDLHQSGYPNSKMFAAGELITPNQNDRHNAIGLVKFAYDEIWFEGDIDGDGSVDVVNFKLRADANGNCPCTIARSVAPKVDGDPSTAQNTSNYSTELQQVVNSGGANGGASQTAAYAIDGSTTFNSTPTSNNTLYAAYKTANVFSAFLADGSEVTGPVTYAGNPTGIKSIRTIRININLLTSRPDLQTKLRAPVTLAASVRVPSN